MNRESFCSPHFRRTGERILATRTVNYEPMCARCFRGKPIEDIEDRVALPFCRDVSPASAPLARSSDHAPGGGETAPRSFRASTASVGR